MNTIRSTWIGWGTLAIAGGGAYYFAKKSINADRSARFDQEIKKKAQMVALEAEHKHQQSIRQANMPPPSSESPTLKRARFQSAVTEDGASPSTEGSHDPAPTRHEPETEEERVLGKSKYETAQPFRPPRGNRLS